MEKFIQQLPKAELHIHIEGSLEPELMFDIAVRNNIALPFKSIAEARLAYDFSDLQSFLDIYYAGANVLLQEADFYDMTLAYMKRASEDNVRHTEIFFDPQTHTERDVSFDTVIRGIHRALRDAETEFGMTSKLIMCFLRHLSAESALATLEQSLEYRDWIIAVGLDSSEVGHPPEKFKAVFDRAQEEGFLTVAHAGEEGPPDYIWQALDLLNVARIDHGIRAIEDEDLLERLGRDRTPLTVCPLSNVKLGVFPNLEHHNLKKLLDRDLLVTINSDDPAYFGGYIGENYRATQQALGLSRDDIHTLARNSFVASFLDDAGKQRLIQDLADYVAGSH